MGTWGLHVDIKSTHMHTLKVQFHDSTFDSQDRDGLIQKQRHGRTLCHERASCRIQIEQPALHLRGLWLRVSGAKQPHELPLKYHCHISPCPFGGPPTCSGQTSQRIFRVSSCGAAASSTGSECYRWPQSQCRLLLTLAGHAAEAFARLAEMLMHSGIGSSAEAH